MNYKVSDWNTVLSEALGARDFGNALAAIIMGANPNQKHTDTPALTAAIGRPHVIRALCKLGANPNDPRIYRNLMPLHQAAEYCDIDSAKALIDSGCEINLHDRHGNTALHWLVDIPRSTGGFRGHVPSDDLKRTMVQLLLDNGVDPSTKNNAGNTVRELAGRHNDTSTIALLDRHRRRNHAQPRCR